MHDIDRTQMEYGFESAAFEGEQFDMEGEYEEGEFLSEADEMELASELLSVSNEAELEQFLGGLISKVANVAGKVIRSPIGRAVGGVLKTAAKKALPLAGGAVGGYFGGPLGAKIGSGLASAAGKAIGLEAESEDMEFEGAKQFVRFAANTVAKAASAPASADPKSVAQSAAVSAAKQFAPALLGKAGAAPAAGGRAASGRWMRRGSKIVLYGV